MASACLVFLASAEVASAHAGDQSYLYLDVTEQTLSGRAELPIVDLRTALGLELEGTDEQILAELIDNSDALYQYADEHFDIGPGDQGWAIRFGEAELFFSDAPEVDDNYVVLPFDVVVEGDAVPRQFDVRFDLFFDENQGGDALLLIGNDWQGGVIDNGGEDLATFDSNNRSQTIDLGDPSVFKNFASSVRLGGNHIKTGPDHILFVLVLLLPSVLIFRDRWLPTDGFVPALWRVLKVVTMFTVAHSITFTLAGLDLLPLPSPRIVESIIALSIAAAALHNLRPLAANKEWLISFAFGLFHGMGFASLVSGLDVSRETQLVSLLGRNVGIEIGQAIVVLLLFPMLFLLRRTKIYRPLFVAISLLLSFVALAWMIERLFDTDVGINTFVDPVFVWPRVVYYVFAATAVSAAYFLYERSGDRLLPTAGSPAPVEESPAEDSREEEAARL
ncbi:MAG: HupE/UreJ family protein [Acidimicrobiales bacterium]